MKGQINRTDFLGNFIYEICKREDVKNIVEIGTWNGMGSTKCIYDAIKNKKDYNVISLETDEYWYNQAVNNIPKLENFNIILGRIIEVEELYGIDKYKIFSEDVSVQQTWLEADITNYEKIKNVIDVLPEKIDVLILDGGEFSSYAEFEKLKDRTTYFILDDTKLLKNYEVAKIMRNDNTYEVIIDSDERNGFLISKKKFI